MKFRRQLLLLAAAMAMTSLAQIQAPNALAGDCFQDPIYDHEWTAKVVIGARVRDVACMDGSVVLTTVPVGTTIAIIGETDGWYKVRLANGTEGWVGQTLLSVTSKDALPVFSAEPTPAPQPTPAPSKPTTSPSSTGPAATRLRGYILLQVEAHGEAWYVRPEDGKRYYMKDGPTAYQMMREFGLGITDADLAKLQAGNATLRAQLKGKIVLQVQQHGEAYYISPKDGSVHYLKDGDAAYQIMRQLSLGITNKDLVTITDRDFAAFQGEAQLKRAGSTSTPASPEPGYNGQYQNISVSSYQKGTVSAGLDLTELNRYWLQKINALRAAKGLRQLVLDQRWVDTATEWAAYMGETNVMTHNRPDGKTMHQWIDAKGLPFTKRYSDGGWETNYFTENIAYGYSDGSMDGMKKALDETLEFYLSEEASNGPHYRTIYYPDWNSVGAGFYFDGEHDHAKVSMAFHYGSLVQ